MTFQDFNQYSLIFTMTYIKTLMYEIKVAMETPQLGN